MPIHIVSRWIGLLIRDLRKGRSLRVAALAA